MAARAILVALVVALIPVARIASADPQSQPTLADAQHLFYTARYPEAAALAMTLRAEHPEDLTAFELRTSALLFQVRRAIGDAKDKDAALKACAPCADVMVAFQKDIVEAQTIARARLAKDPKDNEALFFLGKIDLNHVWLHLGTLGKKTGWGEYWEGRKSLDAVLKLNPQHVRARVARAWIDYIVDTKAPFGFKWILGGGSKKKGLAVMREASAVTDAPFYVKAEAGFGLWDMLVREKNYKDAVVVARTLIRDFPDNKELTTFLEQRGSRPEGVWPRVP